MPSSLSLSTSGVKGIVGLVAWLSVAFLVVASVTARAASGDEFRPPLTPLVTFSPMHQIFVLANDTNTTAPKWSDRDGLYWDGNSMALNVMVRFAAPGEPAVAFQLLGENNVSGATSAMLVEYPTVGPLVTHFKFEVVAQNFGQNQSVFVHLRVIHLKLPTRLDLAAWPLVFLEGEVDCPTCVEGTNASFYLDFSSRNAMHLLADEAMQWDVSHGTTASNATFHFAKLGTEAQPILQSYGDDFMLDWGFLYVATMEDSPTAQSFATGANASACEQGFAAGNPGLPPKDRDQPRLPSLGDPRIAAMTTTAIASGAAAAHFAIGYDERGMQYYFGDTMHGAWKRQFTSFEELLAAAVGQYGALRAEAVEFDAALTSEMTRRISPHYSRIASLAYRQTWAAVELSHSERYDEPWTFLKEISSDGDINTMDVIFPASPLFLYFAPGMIKQLLLPVLRYAMNETWNSYYYPFSPHQLGTYPVANISCWEQEIMPAENTGNMFLMLLGYCKATNWTDTDWIYLNFWDLLTDWAMYQVETQLPVPPFQICTDDFAGPLAQNVNLAAKCVVALEAFAELCDAFHHTYGHNATVPQPKNGWRCDIFHNLSLAYAEFWSGFGVEIDPVTNLSHSRLAFNQPNTWSTKYNLLWQKLLGLSKPFVNFATLARNEVAYYQTKRNEYGFPMDLRHTYQKLDWMTWGSCLSDNVTEFAELFEGLYRMANDTDDRWPLTDLFDTVTADIVFNFRSRPVVGAVFAAMMLY